MPNTRVGHRSKDAILRVVQLQMYYVSLQKQTKKCQKIE